MIWTSTRVALCLAVLTTGLAACGPPATRGHLVQTRTDYDPLQPLNRKVFWFNDRLDVYVLAPVAKGWNRVAPDPVQRSLSNFFVNLRSPIVIVNDVLQGKVKNGASDFGRFAVNTTVGVVGFFDYATPLGLEQHVEDFGQTLGWWGLTPGAYFVIPLLGPSSVRDIVGLMADSVTNVSSWFAPWDALAAARVVDTINTRALFLQQVEEAKRASFDYYVFVRDAYLQRRNALVNDRVGGTNIDQEGLYGPEANDELYHPNLDAPPLQP
ncbi:MAG: VacJ family lipoprotein [Deltaproteobacteria bacterium]|nr:VacJ family lipoprotein [Deltaproteobacteria bacterium]